MQEQEVSKGRVSVIIPTYNRAEILVEAITSVLNQTYQNFELLIVDDHSTDKTEKLVNHFDDRRVVYLKNRFSKGAQGARNTGLYAATGEWIALLDSDDIWMDDKLEKQMEYKSTLKEPVGLFCGYALYDFRSQRVLSNRLPERHLLKQKELLYKNFIGGLSTFMFRKDAALKLGGFDESFPALQDLDFYVALSEIGRIYALNEVLVYIRTDNRDRISKDYSVKYTGALIFKDKYSQLFDLKLKNRANSRLLVFAYKNRSLKFFKHIHWILVGPIIDFSNFKWMVKEIIKG